MSDSDVPVSLNLGSTANASSFNAYVMGLLVSKTPCFGHYGTDNAICSSCPIMGSCKAHLYEKLVTLDAALRQEEERAARTSARVAAMNRGSVASEDLDGILRDLNTPVVDPTTAEQFSNVTTKFTPKATSPTQGERILIASSASTCFVCRKEIPARSRMIFVPMKGSKHEGC